MHTITAEWLYKFSRNGKSGWNKDQLALIEVSWPPWKGWMKASVGMQISDEAREQFEALAGKSQEGVKIDRGRANMAENPIYRTFQDGKGGWAGAWKGDARYPWAKP